MVTVTHYRGYAEQMMLKSPEIRMRITDQGGDDIRTAMVSIDIISIVTTTLSCFHFIENISVVLGACELS